ncbi:MAG: hypothetical protein KAR06_07990 [Deltaproteobacteria bacterium]|nr:hypothetical protein [Deltaproteobacteria bacterium]
MTRRAFIKGMGAALIVMQLQGFKPAQTADKTLKVLRAMQLTVEEQILYGSHRASEKFTGLIAKTWPSINLESGRM